MTADLFESDPASVGGTRRLGAQALLLHGFALPWVGALWPALQAVIAQAPPRQLLTPGGQRMSAARSNCGALGWVSDRRGYRYSAQDPDSGRAWPALPASFLALAGAASAEAGFDGFVPDTCVINRYAVGARMGLHQDRDERDLAQPIVSVSLGLPAVFLWGGLRRADRTVRVPLLHGDVVVRGGVDRLRFHGIAPLPEGHHPLTGAQRINFTLRRAG